eukprot:1087766-Rhodomonas_salina.3
MACGTELGRGSTRHAVLRKGMFVPGMRGGYGPTRPPTRLRSVPDPPTRCLYWYDACSTGKAYRGKGCAVLREGMAVPGDRCAGGQSELGKSNG